MKRCLLVLLFALPFCSFAQKNVKKGYLLKNAKDTISGYLVLKENQLTPTSVSFGTTLDGEYKVYTLADCKGFGYDGIAVYERFTVSISLGSEDLANLSSGPDTTTRSETVFLKRLSIGPSVSLYTYTDKIKKRFYILEKDATVPYELIRRIYTQPGNSNLKISQNSFIEKLKQLNSKYLGDNKPENIDGIGYKESEIVKIVATINKQEIIKSKVKGTQSFAGVGLNVSKGFYRGQTPFNSNLAKVNTSYYPMLTVGIDLFSNPTTKKLVYRSELSLLMSKNEISTTTDDASMAALSHKFDQFTIALTPQILYNFYQANALKVFVTAGAALNFSTYSNNVSSRTNSFRKETIETPNQVDIHNFNFGIQFTGGVMLNNRIEISAGLTLPSVISEFGVYDLSMKRYRVGVNYIFGKP